ALRCSPIRGADQPASNPLWNAHYTVPLIRARRATRMADRPGAPAAGELPSRGWPAGRGGAGPPAAAIPPGGTIMGSGAHRKGGWRGLAALALAAALAACGQAD